MKKIKIVLRIIVLLVILFFVFNYIQGILVNKEKIMDSNNYSYKPIYSNMYLEYLKVNNVFNIITPKVVVIVYIIIQLVLLIIAIKQKNFKYGQEFEKKNEINKAKEFYEKAINNSTKDFPFNDEFQKNLERIKNNNNNS